MSTVRHISRLKARIGVLTTQMMHWRGMAQSLMGSPQAPDPVEAQELLRLAIEAAAKEAAVTATQDQWHKKMADSLAPLLIDSINVRGIRTERLSSDEMLICPGPATLRYEDDPRKPHELSLAGCRCVRFGKDNPHWPCPLHDPAPAEEGKKITTTKEDGSSVVWSRCGAVVTIHHIKGPKPTLPEGARPSDDDMWDQTLTERDNYHEAADDLTAAIAKHFGQDFGEHSNLNCPWDNALGYMADAPQPPGGPVTREEAEKFLVAYHAEVWAAGEDEEARVAYDEAGRQLAKEFLAHFTDEAAPAEFVPQYQHKDGQVVMTNMGDMPPISAAPEPAVVEQKPGAQPASIEQIRLWFFRDLSDTQRLCLFSLCGWPAHELTTHSAQSLVLRKLLATLQPSAPAQDVAGLVEALDKVLLSDHEAANHGVTGAVYWNNAVTACKHELREYLAAHDKQSGGEA